jgi:hypothetical protein
MKKSKISKRTASQGSSSLRPGDIAKSTVERNPSLCNEQPMELQSKTSTPEQSLRVACPLCRRTKQVTLVGSVLGQLGYTDIHYRCSFDPYNFVVSVKDDKPRRF